MRNSTAATAAAWVVGAETDADRIAGVVWAAGGTTGAAAIGAALGGTSGPRGWPGGAGVSIVVASGRGRGANGGSTSSFNNTRRSSPICSTVKGILRVRSITTRVIKGLRLWVATRTRSMPSSLILVIKGAAPGATRLKSTTMRGGRSFDSATLLANSGPLAETVIEYPPSIFVTRTERSSVAAARDSATLDGVVDCGASNRLGPAGRAAARDGTRAAMQSRPAARWNTRNI